MGLRFIIAGTDTEVGKTVFAAALVKALDAAYWKPVQCGFDPAGDLETVRNLTGLPCEKFLPERYRFTRPLSPHRAAELESADIDPRQLALPDTDGPLVVELAGGLMVPLTRGVLQIDVVKTWNAPVVLCARTGLGTINHTLLSVEALRARRIPLHGIAFIGDDNPDTVETIGEFSNAKILGRLPFLPRLNGAILTRAFENHFDLKDFVIPSEAEGSAA